MQHLKKLKFNQLVNLNSSKFSDSLINEISDDIYEQQNKEEFIKFYQIKQQNPISGFATEEGTLRYTQRRPDIVATNHFRRPIRDPLYLSSIGLGTYTGAPDEKTDLKMFNSVIDSIKTGGVNIIDTAINYRYMKSERSIGAALQYMLNTNTTSREELFICSKGGYIPEDSDQGISGKMMCQELVEKKLITQEDIATECHSMHPQFLQFMLQKSLDNLGLSTIDLYYLHNSAEQQMSLLGEDRYFERLSKAFEFCEQSIRDGKIKSYGLASWICFRAKKEEEKIYLSLQKVAELAEKVGGKNHGFKYVQIPINLMMPEAFLEKWQEHQEEKSFALKVARLLNINVISSSPLMQGTLMQMPLPTDVFRCNNLGAKHLQFIRSIPAPALISTLIGQKTNRHTKMNLEVIQHNPLSQEKWIEFMTPKKREQGPEEEIDGQ